MFSSAFFIGLTAFFMVAVNADPTSPCPSVTAMANHDINKVSGQWFVQLVGFHGTNNPHIKCEMRTLTLNTNGGYIDVDVNTLKDDDDAEAFDRNFRLVPQPDNSGYFDVQYAPGNNTHIVIDTDYETYSIWVDCFQLGDAVAYNVVVMTADRVISDDLLTSTTAILAANSLDDGLTQIIQTDCRKTL